LTSDQKKDEPPVHMLGKKIKGDPHIRTGGEPGAKKKEKVPKVQNKPAHSKKGVKTERNETRKKQYMKKREPLSPGEEKKTLKQG